VKLCLWLDTTAEAPFKKLRDVDAPLTNLGFVNPRLAARNPRGKVTLCQFRRFSHFSQ
jgi:hypothetical protein